MSSDILKIALSTLLLPLGLHAQDSIILSGHVIDGHSNEPLPYANIRFEDSNGSMANRYGYFSVRLNTAGAVSARFSYVGYATLDTILAPASGRDVFIIRMMPRAVQLSEVEVVASSFGGTSWYPSTQVLVQKQLSMIPSPGERDLLRNLQKLPGITSSSELSSGLFIRGGTPDQNLILLDGVTIYNPSHVFGFFSMFHHDAIKAVRVMKGGFPSEYGTRSGSVIDILSIDGNRNRTSGKASLGLINAGLMVNGPLANGSYMVAARRSYFEAFDLLMGDLLPDYYFHDIHMRLNQDVNERDRISALFLVNKDNLSHESRVNRGAIDEALHSRWNNTLAGLEWTRIIGSNSFLRVQSSISRYTGNLTATPNVLLQRAFGTGSSLYHYSNTLTDVTWKAELEHSLADGWVFTGGGYYTHYAISYGTDARFDRQDISFGRRFSIAGIFLQTDIRLDELSMVPGARMTGEQGRSGVFLEPRILASYRLTPSVQLKGGIGRYYQWLNGGQPATFLTFSGIDFWFPVERALPPSQSDQISVDATWSASPDLALTISGYSSSQKNITELRQDFENSSRLEEMFILGRGKNTGLEVLLEGRLGDFRGLISYTISRATRRFPAIEQGRRFYARHDKRHVINVVAATTLSDSWEVSLAWNYSTGQAYTGIVGYYELDRPAPEMGFWNSLHFFLSGRNDFRLPPYHRLDLSATKTYDYERWKLRLRIDVFNAYSRLNALGAATGFSSDPYYRLLPIVPTITLEAEF